jgi:U4/U6 small nuclear ribonucleoprotein PRP4
VSDIKFFRASGESLSATATSIVNGASTSASASASASADVDMDASADRSNDAPPASNGTGNGTGTGTGVAASTANLPRSGLFLITAGFDCNVRIWSADEWNLVRNLATDAGKVMSADVSADGRFIASASYSRSFHLFGGDRSL